MSEKRPFSVTWAEMILREAESERRYAVIRRRTYVVLSIWAVAMITVLALVGCGYTDRPYPDARDCRAGGGEWLTFPTPDGSRTTCVWVNGDNTETWL